MESKRRGFKKIKVVMSLYKAQKPSSSSSSNKVIKPSPSAGSMASASFYSDAFKDYSKKQADTGTDCSYGRLEKYNYDESIDVRAASYISVVRARFSLEKED
ncbi:hypothetical protein PTKIN_Ptkin04bG0025400 [Pterospermum kingtungense]